MSRTIRAVPLGRRANRCRGCPWCGRGEYKRERLRRLRASAKTTIREELNQ